MAKSNATLLVTGGSGQLARSVIKELLETTKCKIVTTTRSPEKLSDLAGQGVSVRYADHNDPSSLAQAYEGVDRLLIISANSDNDRVAQIRNVITAAKAAKVKHICYTSAIDPRPNPEYSLTNDYFWCEREIISSGFSYTILRHSMYAEHLFLYLPVAVVSGKLYSCMENGGRACITREDIARADAAALASSSTVCSILDVTGTASITSDDLAKWLTEITGREVTHVRVSPEELLQRGIKTGMREVYARAMVEFDLIAKQGYLGIVTSVVENLTGKAPLDIRDYLAQHRDDLLSGVSMEHPSS